MKCPISKQDTDKICHRLCVDCEVDSEKHCYDCCVACQGACPEPPKTEATVQLAEGIPDEVLNAD